MNAYDKTSIQINRCKRILALVDDYVEKQDSATRTDLRKALMEEFEAPAIAPPVAAGSVDIEEILRGIDQDEVESDDGLWETSFGADFGRKKKAEIIAWGAQQRIEGKREGADTVAMAEQMKLFRSAHDEACIELKERAEKAEARVRDLEEAISTDDRILRSSVPERWKDCASPVGAVQSYIAELEQFEPGNHYDMS